MFLEVISIYQSTNFDHTKPNERDTLFDTL